MEIAEHDREQLEAAAESYEQTRARIDSVLSLGFTPSEVTLALPPRPYQLLPAELVMAAGGAVCGDDVGLGKTISAIVLLARPEARPALVVTLPHLCLQWEREVKRFLPAARTHIIMTRSAQDAKGSIGLARLIEAGCPMPDIVITAYSRLHGWMDWLGDRVKSVVYDEGHELRHGQETKKGQAAAYISGRANYRLSCSATPVYNYGGEIFNVVEMVAPGALGSREEFGRTWCGGYTGDNAKVDNPAALGAFLRERGVFIRRTAAEVGRDLPKVTTVPHVCDVDPHEIDRRVGVEAEDLAKIILAGGDGTREGAMRAGGELDWKLREATGIAKAPVVAEFVKMLAESGEKIVVFAWHRAVYDIFSTRLDALNPVFYTGEESPKKKDAAVKAFVEGNSQVFIASLRSGAGLDGLQFAARIVVFAELDWSPAQIEQCVGRLNRDGQKSPVMAYYLLSESGSDPVIADTLGIKRVQAESIREGRDASVAIEQRDPGGAKRLARAFLRSKGYTDAQLAQIEARSGTVPVQEDDIESEWAEALAKMPAASTALPLFAQAAS